MSNKFDLLRQGHAVTIEPGISGKLNKQKKTLELSTGQVLDVSNRKNFFPENKRESAISKEVENRKIGVEKSPFGEFGHQFSSQGLVGASADWLNYLSKSKEDYENHQIAKNQVSQEISQKSPYVSAVATAASFVPDIAFTRGMSGLGAGALLTASHAGPRILEEPGQVGVESAISGALGGILDKATGYLGRVANRRGQIRELPNKQAQVASENLLEKQAIDEINLLNKNKFNLEKANTTNSNKKIMEEFKNAENLAAKQILEQQNYIKKIPELQKNAQKKFSEEVVKNSTKIEKIFPKNFKIPTEKFNVEKFIDESINLEGLGGTKEASQASKIIKSIFSKEESISAKEISKRYQALENAILKSPFEVQSILNNFKTHLGNELPKILEDSIVFTKIAPVITKNLENDVHSILSKIDYGKNGVSDFSKTFQKAKENIERFLKKDLNSSNFFQKIENGEFSKEVANKIMNVDDFLAGVSEDGIKSIKSKYPNFLQEAQLKHDYFVNELKEKILNRINQKELMSKIGARNSSNELKSIIDKTYGLSPKIETPVSFIPPTIQQPNLLPNPTPPNIEKFIPQVNPTLPSAQGFAERSGDFLENKNLLSGRSLTNNPLTKLAGLKYLLGKAALPAEVSYLAMKGLTSPTATGEITRQSFQQGGILAISSWAKKYPSYHDGILDNPQDRRSLTKEIEDDFSIPLEQKAIIQSKINRGKPLDQPL